MIVRNVSWHEAYNRRGLPGKSQRSLDFKSCPFRTAPNRDEGNIERDRTLLCMLGAGYFFLSTAVKPKSNRTKLDIYNNTEKCDEPITLQSKSL